jgi:hypothetical protein
MVVCTFILAGLHQPELFARTQEVRELQSPWLFWPPTGCWRRFLGAVSRLQQVCRSCVWSRPAAEPRCPTRCPSRLHCHRYRHKTGSLSNNEHLVRVTPLSIKMGKRYSGEANKGFIDFNYSSAVSVPIVFLGYISVYQSINVQPPFCLLIQLEVPCTGYSLTSLFCPPPS